MKEGKLIVIRLKTSQMTMFQSMNARVQRQVSSNKSFSAILLKYEV